MSTKIEWCDETWNPVTGCTPISEGCKNCYAKRMFGRKMWSYDFTPGKLHKDRLDQPMKWKKPRRIFVCSMGDLFHDDVSESDICEISAIMENCPRHTFMLLTKRPERMREYAPSWPNVWMGVTAENQATANERIPVLLQIPAAVRFVSVEPMLGPVSFRWKSYSHEATGETYREYLERKGSVNHLESLKQLDWVIAGPETGAGARPCENDWLENLYLECCDSDVPFFLKRHADGKPSNLHAWPTAKE